MKKLLILLLSITGAFASIQGWYAGAEGRYEYHNYSNSLQWNRNVSLESKSKPHQKLVGGAFVGKNLAFGKNYLGAELKLLTPTSQRKTFAYEDDSINVALKRGTATILSVKAGTFITDTQSVYLKPSVLVAKYTSKNSFKSSKRKINFVPTIGTERLINDKMIMRLEYEYMPSVKVRSTKDGITHAHGEKVHVASAGVAYKF